MTKAKQPSQLRRGNDFHKLIQKAWDDPNDKTFGAEKLIKFEYPPELAKKKRRGRMDIYFDMPDGSGACIFEIKATDWDKVIHRRKLLGAHRRQLMKYVDQYLLLRDISVVATLIYPRNPSLEGVRKEVEDYMGDWAIQVMWYEGQ
jgi:hypothetical protein